MPVISSARCRAHEPEGEIWVGVRTPGTESPMRLDAIADALLTAGAPTVDATGQPDERALSLHTSQLVSYLREAWSRWQGSGLLDDPGQDRVVPYLFPHPGLLGDLPLSEATSVAANAGRHCYDTMTLIGPGTWEAARAALDVAITAADLAVDDRAGLGAAYALCRPPGHHACPDAFGGSCYLNNAAAAAAAMRERLGGTVAVIDIDAHHGNGTQSIFYEDASVLTGSVHVDPAAGWFPHYLGHATETGAEEGRGANLNVPLAPGSNDDAWIAAIAELVGWAERAEVSGLVVALGVDAAQDDPESPLEVSREGYERAGTELARLGLPTAFVQEGGYDLTSIGELVVATLSGFEAGRA